MDLRLHCWMTLTAYCSVVFTDAPARDKRLHPARGLKIWRGLATSLAATCLVAAPAGASPADWDRASSIVRTGLVGFSLAVPASKGDTRGLKQEALALGISAAVTGALKLSIHERRPDGSDDRSFPSGHTSISFAAAAGLEQRFGWKVGLPAHVAAAFVGLARVEANKHHVHDVIVGAVIGEAAGLLLVHKRHFHSQAPITAGFSMTF